MVELPRESLEDALRLYAHVPRLRLLVVGGDGTVGWVLSCLDALQAAFAGLKEPVHWIPPPVAVWPLGTGNDLAWCLGWGSGAAVLRERGLGAALADLEHAAITLLDRWNVRIVEAPALPRAPLAVAEQLQRMGKSSLGALGAKQRRDLPQGHVSAKAMNNYLGIGVDAHVALQFHRLREEHPAWFRSQMGNKLWYTTLGAKDLINHSSRDLPQKLQVECDGQPLALPGGIEGILVLNIQSCYGGVDVWGSALDDGRAFVPSTLCDGVLELVGVFSVWHLGQLQIGLSRAVRLGQCRHAIIRTSAHLPMQVDGEPWNQPPAQLDISLKGQAFMLRRLEHGPVAEVARLVAETLEAEQAHGTISAQQRATLQSKLAHKLHSVL